jgi:hypothetical protein
MAFREFLSDSIEKFTLRLVRSSIHATVRSDGPQMLILASCVPSKLRPFVDASALYRLGLLWDRRDWRFK